MPERSWLPGQALSLAVLGLSAGQCCVLSCTPSLLSRLSQALTWLFSFQVLPLSLFWTFDISATGEEPRVGSPIVCWIPSRGGGMGNPCSVVWSRQIEGLGDVQDHFCSYRG